MTAPVVATSRFPEKVGANLGVTIDALEAACAAVGGSLMEEGDALKLRIKARSTTQELIDEALAAGESLADIAGALNEQSAGRSLLGTTGGFQAGQGVPDSCLCDGDEIAGSGR